MELGSDIEELLKAFKTLGGDENGKINYNKVSMLLQKKAGLSKQAIASLLERDDHKVGDELNFLNLCTSVVKTKKTVDYVLNENEERPQSGRKKVDNRTFTRRRGSGCSSNSGKETESNNDSQSAYTESLKGCIFDTNPFVGLCGHRFLLQLSESSPTEIIAQAINETGCSPTPTIEIIMFVENDMPNKKLVTFSSSVNSEGYCTIKMNLRKGKYLLVPVTLDWKGEDEPLDPEEMESLTDLDDNEETILTEECISALRTVFDCVDLDRNGMLSENEFDLFVQHICGETACDEWTTIEDNFDTVDGQLTFDGFLSLYKMALVTDFNDVANMFKKMGMNIDLSMKRGCPLLLTVTAKIVQPVLKPLVVSSFETLMEEVFRKTAMEQGLCTKVRNMKDVLLYTHKLDHRVTLVIKNMSHSSIKVRLDCRKSKNCASNRSSLDAVITAGPKTSVIGHHLFPLTHGEPWLVQCVESLVQ